MSRVALNSTCGSVSTRPFRQESRTPPSQSATAAPRSSSGTSPALTSTTVIPHPPTIQTKMGFSHNSRLPFGSPLPEPRRRRTTRAKAVSPAPPEQHHHHSLHRARGFSWNTFPCRRQARRENMPWATPWRCWKRIR
jgi:hypothetical protein